MGIAVLVVVRVLSAAAAQIVGDRFSHRVYVGLCQDMGRRLLGVPMPRLEAIGMPRMLVTLTEDVSVIALAVHSLPGLAINLAILLGCAVYLGWLSWAVFLESRARRQRVRSPSSSCCDPRRRSGGRCGCTGNASSATCVR